MNPSIYKGHTSSGLNLGDDVYTWHIEFLHYYKEEEREMADSLADAAGKGVTWTGPDGKVYKIKPLTIGDLAALEGWIKSEKLRCFLEATKDLDPTMRQTSLVDLCSKQPTQDEITYGMTSMEGIRFLMWRSLSKSHPEITLDYIGNMITTDNIAEVSTIIQMGGSVDEDPLSLKAEKQLGGD